MAHRTRGPPELCSRRRSSAAARAANSGGRSSPPCPPAEPLAAPPAPPAPSNFFPKVVVAAAAAAATAMLDKIEPPRPYTWRSSADQTTTDSGSESHPLMSSDASRRSFGATCMFPDSETSDFEATAPSTQAPREPTPTPAARAANPRQLASARRPFSYQNHQDQLADATYNRFHYYNKLRSYAPYEDSTLMIPDHVIPLPVFIPFIPGQERNTQKQSSLVTIFAVWNTVMGSSLLTMPWGIERAGFVTGIILMALMGGICLYTTYRLLEINKIHGAGIVDGEVADLCKLLLGRPAEIIAKFFSLIVLLGANIVYWILMTNFLYHSVDYIYERAAGIPIEPLIMNDTLSTLVLCPREKNNTIPENIVESESIYSQVWNINVTVPVFLVLIIGPLINFKSATFFTKFNSLGTLSVLYLVLFVLIKAISWGINVDFTNVSSPLYAPSFLPSFPALSGMLALSFFIHNIIISIMRNNRNQEKNGRDLSIAYILVTLTYTFIGAVFYISFPLKKSCISDVSMERN
ncbi:Putative amino acid permease F13H10.3 [Gryllus bimaculatus]|nr:Putative amino acid permease F13H10.3 [Gryllus bimaculatus]